MFHQYSFVGSIRKCIYSINARIWNLLVVLSIAGLGREYRWCSEKFDTLYFIQRLPRKERERERERERKEWEWRYVDTTSITHFLDLQNYRNSRSLSFLSHDSWEQRAVYTQWRVSAILIGRLALCQSESFWRYAISIARGLTRKTIL
jgi:hypothetical protein